MRRLKGVPNGPGWFEVIFGAVLSVALGGLLGVALLCVAPVTVVKELPAEADRDPLATYFVEGSRDAGKGKNAKDKRKAFAEGQSVSVSEDDLNLLAGPPVSFGTPRRAVPKGGAQPAPKSPRPAAPVAAKPGEESDMFSAGTPNFRLHENTLQIGIPVTVSALGVRQKIVVQARGTIVKQGDVFAFEPEKIFVGACPVHRVPYLDGYVREKLLAQKMPGEIAASWAKLASVAIEGNTLRLTMP